MITSPAYQHKKIGVFGLARSGLATVHALVASGATVCAWDDNAAARATVESCAVNLYQLDFADLDALVLAPGVPVTHPAPHALVTKAQNAGVPIISDIDVFEAARTTLPAHKTVAITGTNGKSTTTALIGHIIGEAGLPVAVGGNIGTGVLDLPPLPEGGVYVFELSSFQLDITRAFDADVAVLLNISPDHLDRHGTMDRYVAAKKRLFDMQSGDKVAVIGVDDAFGPDIAATCAQQVVPVSGLASVPGGVSGHSGELTDQSGSEPQEIGPMSGINTLRGAHNWQNAAAAFAACRALGLTPEQIFSGIESFPGLEHRQQVIAYLPGVTVVNDSKATNVDAARRALESFRKIRWIAGGRAKDRDFSSMASSLDAVRKAYLMGEDAGLIAAALPAALPAARFDTMLEALGAALADAEQGDTVLLSPACTAFDQFANFEARGVAFTEAVAAARESAA